MHGLCLGGGIDIIASCDVRYASDDAVFSIKVRLTSLLSSPSQTELTSPSRTQEVDVGLAADVGSLQRLPKETGNASLLYELALTARNFGAEEASKLGLVSRIVKGGKQGVREAALETAKIIASA